MHIRNKRRNTTTISVNAEAWERIFGNPNPATEAAREARANPIPVERLDVLSRLERAEEDADR